MKREYGSKMICPNLRKNLFRVITINCIGLCAMQVVLGEGTTEQAVIAVGATTGTTVTVRARDGRMKHTLDPNGMVHHMQQLAAFRKDAKTMAPVCTLLVGDSITHSFPVGLFDPSERVISHGVGGMMIGGWKYLGLDDVLDVVVLDMKPRRIFMMIGINDFLQGAIFNRAEMTPRGEMLRGYEDILKTIRRELPGCKVYVQALLPLGGNYAEFNAGVDEFNGQIKKLAKKYGCEWLDFSGKFRGADRQLSKELSPEGIHPNSSGYELWAGLLPLKKAK